MHRPAAYTSRQVVMAAVESDERVASIGEDIDHYAATSKEEVTVGARPPVTVQEVHDRHATSYLRSS